MSQEKTWRNEAIKKIDDAILETVQEMVKMHKEEIDRLNAVNAEQAEYIDAINKSSDGLDTAVYLHMCHIEQLQKDLVWEKAFSDEYGAEMNRLESELRIEKSKNSDLTAKVQERDERIEYMDSKIKELTQAWDAEKDSVYFRSSIIRERDKEIAEADAWAEYWRREAFRQHPTQESYDAACAALEKHKERADAGDKEIERLRAENEALAQSDKYREESERWKKAYEELQSNLNEMIKRLERLSR